MQPAGALPIHLVLLPTCSGHGYGQICPAPNTRHSSGSQGPAQCPQADGAATLWEPYRGRDRQYARPWEPAPGWEDRADLWAPLALMPGRTGQLGGSFCSVGLLGAAGSLWPRPSHMAARSGAGICLLMGTRSQPLWNVTVHSRTMPLCFLSWLRKWLSVGRLFAPHRTPLPPSFPAPASQRGSCHLKSEQEGVPGCGERAHRPPFLLSSTFPASTAPLCLLCAGLHSLPAAHVYYSDAHKGGHYYFH